MITLNTILEEFRQTATSTRDLGDKFERLTVQYLETDPLYKEHFSKVWLWMDFPKRNKAPDTGIDLVAEERDTGDYCAIQCKCYDPDYTLQKSDIDSFFTASGTDLFNKRIIVSTTDKWSKHAEDTLNNQQIPVTRLTLYDLDNSPIDWSEFSLKKPQLKLKPKKQIRPHQQTALDKVMAGFQEADRGKLIMACGTGKTFTSLKIAEQFTTNQKSLVLFLVPSISLLSQTLREWTAESDINFHSIAVCSDTRVGRRRHDDDSDITVSDLAFPPTTNAQEIIKSYRAAHGKTLTVIFSTYQSIQAIADAQIKGLPEFDLIICDEAHRTTGVTISGEDTSHFVKVHDQDFLKGKKRLYMTATPKIFSDDTKVQAQENDASLCSMDDVDLYGKEFHRLGFGEAVGNDLLADYKVMVLAVDEKYVSATFQRQLADADNELNLEDAVKITGCWNGLSKRMKSEGEFADDIQPMKRAVAFSRSIKDSEKIVNLFTEIVDQYQKLNPDDENFLDCEVDHVDGTQNALERVSKLEWLKADTSNEGNICRILSNARCLSEGVDIPALDAVIFLTPRNSVVDVVQSVGRVMRKAEGKKYGYIILPVGIPAGMSPDVALKDNQKYKVIWQVLQALRAHDDRFNATVNKIELNQKRPPQINIIGVGRGIDENSRSGNRTQSDNTWQQLEFDFSIEEWRDAIYAKIVVKCGDRRYWEDWAKDVAKIADNHTTRIKALLENSESNAKQAFNEFLKGLHNNLNPNVTKDEAIEMLSQHLITKPVFDALFEGYEFTKSNPVSQTMQKMLDVLEGESLQKEVRTLEKFYQSVRDRASGIDNDKGKQRIIIELYDKFFRAAFPRLVERLGIVYTPVEVVDFIIHSADYALKQEFGVSLTDEGVHILDPFTGTGTFMVRLLQSGLIKPEDLQRKFTSELHANEIVLLAYYIAAINIEETYHYLSGNPYQPFNGIVLTDTFQMFENEGYLMEKIFPENNQRVVNQKSKDITVIVGNPPYSAKQKSANDNNQNLKYEKLDEKIENSYAKYSTSGNVRNLYGSEIRAIKWASERIKDKGIICYVINGALIDKGFADGLRKCLADEFTSIYCFNLRGDGRTSGEQCRKEGHPLFAALGGKGGSLVPISIILLIKNPQKDYENQLFYHDIGDYLKREQKLSIIRNLGDISGIQWESIAPNENYDWINQRNDIFESFISLGDKKDKAATTFFETYVLGLTTNRDVWCYNFSRQNLSHNIFRFIEFYNQQVNEYKKHDKKVSDDNFIDNNPKKISWSRGLKKNLTTLKECDFNEESIIIGAYRPFCKQYAYFDKFINEYIYTLPKFFPNQQLKNLVICVNGIGSQKDFSALITNYIPDLNFHQAGQCFPLYAYEKQSDLGELFATANTGEYVRKENIPDSILKEYQKVYKDKNITKEDIFYYVYGVLHSPEYKQRFASDLKKMLPRVPYCEDFWAFSKAGRDLAYWHLNYETIEPYDLEEWKAQLYLEAEDYRVEKMVFGKNKDGVDKTTIIYNSKLTLSQIPLETYDYIVNGKSALDWVMERYKFTKDKDSGITNNPNDWSDDPRYIVDLVKRIVRVSLETVRIVKSLPALNEKEVK
ncbi:DEAD/DEAH box helicase family protein [Planktothrix agardhii 1801]|uniref:DEAD/DEAH box helicase n=1 Tax=Planktothrix agardhii TaxID=1160 RepID=UPI001F24FEDE|nr:type ISP restriction/modification enzyme [Planktothrix agardhii]MCF3627379.1 DEAD/DEAH box helicase family protein [Planktothrix agardhii 1801]